MTGHVQGRYPVPARYGERVRYRRREACGGLVPARDGEGTFTLCWLGIEECWEVTTDAGETVHLHPCFGDEMEPVVEARTDGTVGSGPPAC